MLFRSLGLGVSGEQEAGRGAGVGQPALKVIRMGIRSQGQLGKELELHHTSSSPVLRLPCWYFREVPTCPWFSPSGDHDSLGGGLSGTTGVALPAAGQAAHTASHPHWGQLSTRGCSCCWINAPSPSPPGGNSLDLKVTSGVSCTGSQRSPVGPGPSCPRG